MDLIKGLSFCPASEELPVLESESATVDILVNVNFVILQIASIKLDFVLIFFPH